MNKENCAKTFKGYQKLVGFIVINDGYEAFQLLMEKYLYLLNAGIISENIFFNHFQSQKVS